MEHVHEKSSEQNKSYAVGMLLFSITLALLAMLLWKTCGVAANGTEHNAGHGSHGAGHNEPATETHSTETSIHNAAGKLDTLSGNFIYETGNVAGIDLPGGAKLSVGEYSTEAKLVKFLMDKTATLDTVKGNWFEFTNVRFKTGGAQIDSASIEQIKNMVAIANSFSSAQFKIGGYTDNSGDAAKNVALSQKRADAVLAELIKQGAKASSFTGAKGYGPEWPIADNTTAEGRAMNRRVAVNVKAK